MDTIKAVIKANNYISFNDNGSFLIGFAVNEANVITGTGLWL